MLGKKKRNFTEPREPAPRPQRVGYPVAVLFRMFVLGSVAVIGSLYALWRHYNVPRTPMLVPAPSATEVSSLAPSSSTTVAAATGTLPATTVAACLPGRGGLADAFSFGCAPKSSSRAASSCCVVTTLASMSTAAARSTSW